MVVVVWGGIIMGDDIVLWQPGKQTQNNRWTDRQTDKQTTIPVAKVGVDKRYIHADFTFL